MEAVNCSTIISTERTHCSGSYRNKVLIYYPSNSKKGIAIKGTNLRVELV